MIYVMSDLHGCYEEYKEMLELINFSKEDTLYILGDVIDRGEGGIDILLDMMRRTNVIPMLGNHELMAYEVLSVFNIEITEDNMDKCLNQHNLELRQNWMFNGGQSTERAFTLLNHAKRKYVLEYFEEFNVFEQIEVNGRNFILVHGGFKNFEPNKAMDDYSIYELVWGRCDYETVYFDDTYLVTGHTPTFTIGENYRGKIYQKNNHIAIDCGVIFGEALGCICLDTLEEFYVKKKEINKF